MLWFYISTLVGFKDPDFYKTYSRNSYSVEIHSRTNAIGLPITAEVNSSPKTWSSQSISLINKSVFFKCGLSHNNSRRKIDYVPKFWQIKSIPLIGVNGKILKIYFIFLIRITLYKYLPNFY